MNRYDFVQALNRARRGDHIVYHTGLLMRDRQLDKDVDKTANVAYEAYQNNKCTLVQARKYGAIPSACYYVAVKL